MLVKIYKLFLVLLISLNFETSFSNELDIENCSNLNYINFKYNFNWDDDSQKQFLKKLKIKCEDQNSLLTIQNILNNYLIKNYSSSFIIKTIDNQKSNIIPSIKIDNLGSNISFKNVLLPVKKVNDIVNIFEYSSLNGRLKVGEYLNLVFVINENVIVSYPGNIFIEWYRNNKKINNQNNSSYQLSTNDIGKIISAKLSYIDNNGVVLTSRTENINRKVVDKEYRPNIKNLFINGNFLVGEELSVSYQFYDRNSNDVEENTIIHWLRNNEIIPNQNKFNYKIVPNDEGKIISVRIIPRSKDGITGNPVNYKSKSKVKFKKTISNQHFLNQKQEKEKDFVLVDLDTNMIKNYNFKNEIEKSNIILIDGLEIPSNSHKTFFGLEFLDNQLLPLHKLDEIEASILGNSINIENIKNIIKKINTAFLDIDNINSHAIIPKQIIQDGILQIKFVQLIVKDSIILDKDKIYEDFNIDKEKFVIFNSI